MHADIVGIAPGEATRRGQEQPKIGRHLLAQVPRAGRLTAAPAYAPRTGRTRPAYARATRPQPLRPAATPPELPCRSDPELFFAEAPADIRLAKELCGLCPVRRSCLAGALQRAEPHGVWGGELFLRGAIIAEKRPRGRPPKSARPVGEAPVASAWRSAS